ncbi:probable pre-mRNA-splicing factor ATP-dependent RNA helicase DEAH9 [Caerostris darwini]|uniref:Probable pre-mRNA-splicing factor ATP-dependent RNA helicase DEAH9 n=1 Tax=Caerostris darwini TaxID=1538125 RepID=A0AAV4M4F2_9ARAC|nr:probable pre-mRNA-splicing factor ATP-dependent RNA helicase DEAH9 [Caerostris darwini]
MVWFYQVSTHINSLLVIHFMNRNRNKQRSRQNRNSGSQNLFFASQTTEKHQKFYDHRMSNFNESGKTSMQDDQEERFPIRAFCEGKESETHNEQHQSLDEQRTSANQQRGRGVNRRQNNYRGSIRGRKQYNRRTPLNASISDTESVSSYDSQSQQQKNNFNFSYSNTKPTFSHSVSEPAELVTPNPVSETNVRYPSSDPNKNVTFPVTVTQHFKHIFKNPSDIIKFPNADIENSSYPEKNLDYQPNHTDFTSNSSLKKPRDVLSEYRNYTEKCQSLLRNLTPTEIIMDCRQKVEDDAKECIVQCLKKIKELSKQENCSIFALHKENLLQQQKQFEDYIAQVKGQLTFAFSCDDVQEILKSCDHIKKNVKKECNVFARSLPAYAFKANIVEKIQKNQVTIISTDSTYFLNILIPIFIKNEFPNHFLICSETCQILTESLKKNIFELLHHKVETDESEEAKFNNEFNFMTVEEMLNLFVSNYQLNEKNVFAVVNLSLKRSLEQDIVLANLRDDILSNKESKLVLMTSFCDQIHKYKNYFSGKVSVGIIEMPSLVLPVKKVWKSSALLPTDDYVEELVKTILAIHVLNGPGDVMAFLPTLTDARSVSIAINEKLTNLKYDLKCDILSENSLNKQCLDLFIKKSSDKRTVFLVTDCAEMLVIPSVRYIVDCGLRKDNIFDSDKKIDVLSTTFISRSKSKLRKSLAGTFNAGICYRLYSKENYEKEMPSVEYPEILTVNPFNSMIKIFQYKPDAATTVEFVESLPADTKENALKLLKKYNAIRDNALTDLGKSMVKLPFPAKYSKLIVLGIHWDLAYEAVILVAFFSAKGRVFKYSADVNRQREIDAVKLSLIQYDSDTISYLYIYKVWLNNNCSEEWCENNCINYTTMKNIHAKVNEICQIVGDTLKESIQQDYIKTREQSTTSLLEMLFDCLLENLCVFTGHYRSGYRVLSSHCISFLHPSSIICQMENLPQFIVFDHMITTNRDFLMSITAIPPELVMKALTEQLIDFDYSDMFEKTLVQRIIEPVGERMIKQVLLGKKGKKLKAIEASVKLLLNTDSLVIEPVAEKGRVLVYALTEQVDEAVKLINDVLKRQFEDLVNLEQIHTLELKRGQIVIPIEITWLRGAKVQSVKTGMPIQGSVASQKDCDDEENPPEQQPCNIQQSVNITWIRRTCDGIGFVTFRGEDFMMARKHAMRSFKFLNSDVFVQVSRNEKYQLYLQGIPPNAKSSDLEKAFCNLLSGIKPVKVELKYTAPFETSESDLQEIKVKLEEICLHLINLSDFKIVVPMPKSSATIMKAFINLGTEEDTEKATKTLSECIINDSKLTCRAVYRSIIKSNTKVCEALKPRFMETLNDLKRQFLEDKLFEFFITQGVDDLAVINMLSNKRKVLEMLLRVVNELLEGEILNKNFNIKLNKIFCHGGHMWLRSSEKISKVHIIEDYSNKSLRLYGSKENCKLFKQQLRQFLDDTVNEAVTSIILSNKRKLMKEIIKKYGANLEKFIEYCELQTAMLDIRTCTLSLHGSRESIEMAEETLKELAAGLHSIGLSDVMSDEEVCPVCSCPAFSLTFRLELCGHLYCSECIEGLVEQAQFPLRCCAEDCCHDIVLDDICRALGDDPAKIKLNCPLCQNDICVKCNVVYHQGFTCDMYQGSKNDPDYSFKVWQKNSEDCKRCPKCNTAIQKSGGCDHMTCQSCNSHFCWQCVKEFANATKVYEHLPFCDAYPS